MKTSNLSVDNFKKILDLDGSTPEPAIPNNNNNANLLNITYEKYPKLCEKNMTRNANNNTVGNTHQLAIEMQVKSKSYER